MSVNFEPRFTYHDATRASAEWGANCGPGAIAAICGLTLDELRPMMGDFEKKHFTNPTLMWEVLRRTGIEWSFAPPNAWPQYGLARIQWEGPWTEPGVPTKASYRQTHWVGSAHYNGEIGVFDINAMNNGRGWVSLENWTNILVPFLLKVAVPRANGKWHITHSIEVKR